MRDDLENRIDDYFREGLDNLNVIPPVEVWNNISGQLPVKKNRTRMVIWIAVAASVSLFAAISGWNYLNRSEKSIRIENEAPLAQTQKKDHSNTSINSTPQSGFNKKESQSSSSVASVNQDSQQIHSLTTKNSKTNTLIAVVPENQKNISDSKSIEKVQDVVKSQDPVGNTSFVPASASKQETSENFDRISAIAWNMETPSTYGKVEQGYIIVKPDIAPVYDDIFAYDETAESKEKLNRWAIGGQMAPLYSYRSISDVNAPGLSKASMNKVENAVITYSSGVKVDYEATSRLTFQTGVYYMKMGQEINNVSSLKSAKVNSANIALDAQYANMSQNYNASNSTGTIIAPSAEIYPQGSLTVSRAEYTVGNLAARPADLSQKDIEQSFDFIEVPFLAKYKIIDRKINVHLLGGMSTHVLVGNKTTLRTGPDEVIHGKTADVETMNYSSSVGFGVVYNLRKNLMFSVEPTFKYYLNSFNSSDAVKLHPYALGLYSGFSFKF